MSQAQAAVVDAKCVILQWRNLLEAYAAGAPPADPEALWNVGGAYHAALLEAEMRAALRGDSAVIAAASTAHTALLAALR